MNKGMGFFQHFYRKLQKINDRVIGGVATVLFSLLYVLILPWFAVFVKKPPQKIITNWHPWPFRSETIEDLRKQY